MVIHHVADSETNSYVRLRRLLAEPAGTVIQGYDEAQWAQVLHYDRPVGLSLAVFRAVRDSSAELLDLITPDDLARAGVHSESGPYTVADWLDTYVAPCPRPRRADPRRPGLRSWGLLGAKPGRETGEPTSPPPRCARPARWRPTRVVRHRACGSRAP